jgi:hypothetical protein
MGSTRLQVSASRAAALADVVVGVQQDNIPLALAFSTMAGHRIAWI